MSSLFAPRAAQAGKPTHDELRNMAADMRGFHYRLLDSMALLARLVATDAAKYPAGLDAVIVERLDDGRWSFVWNGTAAPITTPAHTAWKCPPLTVWPRHAKTFKAGLPSGHWSDSAGWQDFEADWLHALETHVAAREPQPTQQQETGS